LLTEYLFVTEESGLQHLKSEGKPDDKIFFVGNIMIDTLLYSLKKTEGQGAYDIEGDYAVLTMHRPSNVDDKEKLQELLQAFVKISNDLPIVFPMHPRTKKRIEEFGLNGLVKNSNLKILPPLPYLDFLSLWKNAKLVITDSGGIQEETTVLGVPCFTIRENTERPITIEQGTNILVGTNAANILKAFGEFKSGKKKTGVVPNLWDGKTAERIIKILSK